MHLSSNWDISHIELRHFEHLQKSLKRYINEESICNEINSHDFHTQKINKRKDLKNDFIPSILSLALSLPLLEEIKKGIFFYFSSLPSHSTQHQGELRTVERIRRNEYIWGGKKKSQTINPSPCEWKKIKTRRYISRDVYSIQLKSEEWR